MKIKLYILILLFIGYINCGNAQWIEKNIQINTNLSSVSFIDNDEGYVAGSNKIFKTINGGDNWEISFEVESAFLEDIFVINNSTVIAVGKDFVNNQSLIIKTKNNGKDWNIIPIEENSFIKSVFFINNEIGYFCGSGGEIYITNDGGENWIEQESGVNISLQSINFINEDVGMAVGGWPGTGIILKTLNGGDIWNEISSSTSNNLQSVYLLSNETGYIVGWNGEIMKTIDCGENWTFQNSVDMSGNLEVIFTDSNTGYIVGGNIDDALIQKTTNGGQEWIEIGPELSKGLTSICFPSFESGYAVGSNGLVLKTSTGGEVTSIEETNITINNLVLYPNPTNEKILFRLEKDEEIESVKIYNQNGKLILDFLSDHITNEIEIKAISSGNYYILVKGKNKYWTSKFVKI